jgi:Domain of unknown function (DUF4124)
MGTMRKPSLFLVFCSTLLLSGTIAQAATQPSGRKSGSQPAGGSSGRTYKWVDSSGVTHYGDSIPPEYAQGSRSELNSQGVEVRKVPAQLSPQEAAVAEKNEADISKRRQHDTFLLNTYVSARDIEQLRDERIALIDSQLGIARGSIESIDGRMKAISTRMGAFKPYSKVPTARRLPDPLAEEAVRVLQERRSMDETVAARQQEMQELRKQFDADLARYRELTANRLPR